MLSILFNCILFKNAVLINCESFQLLFYIPLNMHLRLRLSFWLFDHPCTCRIFTPDYIKVVRKLVWLKFCRVIISSNHNVCVHVAFLEQAFCSFDLLLEHCVVITVDLNLSTETTSQVRLQFATFTPEQGLRNNFFTARCTILKSAVLRLHVVRLSVCLSASNVGGWGPHRLEILETNCTV